METIEVLALKYALRISFSEDDESNELEYNQLLAMYSEEQETEDARCHAHIKEIHDGQTVEQVIDHVQMNFLTLMSFAKEITPKTL